MARYQIRYRLAAVEELQEAIDWYSRQDATVGQRLRVTIREKIGELRSHPLLYAADADDLRETIAKPFPYRIVYYVKDPFVEVLAIAHTSREHGYWRDRLNP